MAITDNNKPTIDRLKDLKNLYEAGILTQEEMEAEKAEILGTSATPTEPVKKKATIACPYCGELISDEAKTCPYCGSGETWLQQGNEMNIKQIEAC